MRTSASALVRARRAAAAALSEPLRFTCAISSGVGEDTGTTRLLLLSDRDLRGRLCVACLHVLYKTGLYALYAGNARKCTRLCCSVQCAEHTTRNPQPRLRSGAISSSACLLLLAGLQGALTGTTIAGVGELAGAGSDPARY